jgi:hypothetical protein
MKDVYKNMANELIEYLETYIDLKLRMDNLVREGKEKGFDLPLLYDRSYTTPNQKEVYTIYNEIASSIEDTKRKIEEIYATYDLKYGTNWGWCSLNKAGCIIDCINDICSRVEQPVCVEIGVYGGKSVIPAVLELKRLNKGKFYAIDPWDNIEATKGYEGEHYNFWFNVDLNNIYNLFLNLLNENDCQEYVEIIRKPSDDAPEIFDIDFLYIDGQHTDQAIRDVYKYASKVKLNGYCIVDDINRDVWGEVSTKTPDILESMGFGPQKYIDDAIIFKRIVVK